MSFPIVLRKTMGQNVLEILYNSLLGFGIIINVLTTDHPTYYKNAC